MSNKYILGGFAGAVLVMASFGIIAKEVTVPNMRHFSQSNLILCGAAVAKMWIHHINGWSPSQDEIKNQYFWRNGMDSYEMERRVLERFTNKGFNVRGLPKESKARRRIYKELRKQRRPLAIAGTTVRADGSFRAGGHWKLIYSADIRSKHSGYKVSWVKLMDPLYGIPGINRRYVTVAPGDKLKADALFGMHWRSWANGDRQAVED